MNKSTQKLFVTIVVFLPLFLCACRADAFDPSLLSPPPLSFTPAAETLSPVQMSAEPLWPQYSFESLPTEDTDYPPVSSVRPQTTSKPSVTVRSPVRTAVSARTAPNPTATTVRTVPRTTTKTTMLPLTTTR